MTSRAQAVQFDAVSAPRRLNVARASQVLEGLRRPDTGTDAEWLALTDEVMDDLAVLRARQ